MATKTASKKYRAWPWETMRLAGIAADPTVRYCSHRWTEMEFTPEAGFRVDKPEIHRYCRACGVPRCIEKDASNNYCTKALSHESEGDKAHHYLMPKFERQRYGT